MVNCIMASMTRLENKPNSRCRKWRFFASKGSGKDRVQKSMRFEGTYTEAKRALADFQRGFDGKPPIGASGMTFRELADEWLEWRRGQVEESTRTKDRRAMTTACHVIGKMPICGIDTLTINTMYARLRAGDSPTGKKLKTSYVSQIGISTRQALAYAVDRGILPSNPCDGDDLPPVRVDEKVPPTAAEVSDALRRLDVSDPRHMCIYLCASMGLRKGEALGVRWRDVDGDVLHVVHQIRQPRELAPLKTGAGRRDLPIPPHVHQALETRAKALRDGMEICALAGVDVSAPWDDLHVCSRPDGLVVSSESMSCWWKVYGRKVVGLDCTIHDLRHAYLTAAAVNGVPPRVMQALAGHASPITTMKIYAHANMDAKSDAARIVASVLHP